VGRHRADAEADVLELDVDAVPTLRKAYADALATLDQQLSAAEAELRVPAWAADPVSADATADFNRHSVDHGDSALDQLRAYRELLADAVASLDATAADYAALDHIAGADVTRQGGA
jgi:hypothetical protein